MKIDLSQLVNIVILLGSFIGAVSIIIAVIKKTINKLFAPVTKKLEKMDVQQCRTYLVNFLCDLEYGAEKDEVQYKLAHEIYDRYTNELHQNSYVHDKWDRVMCKQEHK